jgi:hypothetical protein
MSYEPNRELIDKLLGEPGGREAKRDERNPFKRQS